MNTSRSVLRAAAVVLWLVLLEAGRFVVLVQVGLECEALAAAFAGVVLKGRVRLHVSAQVGAVGEGLATVGAGERFLPGVGPHVALQKPRSTKGFAAHRALVLQVMG